jgi:hypothetical protein
VQRRTATWLGILLASALAACGRSDTGVHIFARLGSLQYDELQFQVTRTTPDAGTEVVVDPATTGRYQGPFRGGDQDVLVYLRDDLAGSQLHCETSALQGNVVVGHGASDTTVIRGEMKDVEIFMADASGGSGGVGGTGTPPPTGTGGTGMPPTGSANGEVCGLGAECLTGHCADGVCCESDCQMACHSCGLADSKGLCRAVAVDTPDPRGMCSDQGSAGCKTNGLCDGAGKCAQYPAGTACGVLGCADMGKAVVPAPSCDGAGKCQSPAKIKCPEGTSCVDGLCTGV